jgi:O-antigen ligase
VSGLSNVFGKVDGVLQLNKVVGFLLVVMSVGLFLQLTGKIVYSSGSANGAHVYVLLILPSLCVAFWFAYAKQQFFSRDAGIFLGLAAVFMAWGVVATGWGDGEFSFLYLLKRALVIFLYIVAIIFLVSFATVRHIKGFLLLVVMVVAVGALVSIYYQFFVLDQAFGWRSFRLSSMGYRGWVDLGNPVIAGLYMGIFAVITLNLIAVERQAYLLAVFVILVVLASYIFLSYSRTTWVAGVVSAVFLLNHFRSRSLMIVAIASVLCFVIIAGFYFDEFLREITHKQLSRRGETWRWALNNISENIVFGHGYNHTFWPEKHFTHAHNFYLQTAYEQGLIGLVALFGMLSWVCRCYWKNRKDIFVCLGFSMVIYILVAMLSEIDQVITRPGVYWTIFWFPLAFTIGAVNRARLLKSAVAHSEE